jgi:cytochrome c oxidase cbb3-type subunit I/II
MQGGSESMAVERFAYDDAIVRKFVAASLLWGAVGMLVGLWLALEMAFPQLNLGIPWLSFGRLRPLHTNAVIFAFAGNAIFAAVYWSSQRLLKARMASDRLSAIHFWGWQAIIVAAAITLPLGYTQTKEYAELEWPLDLAIAVVWIVFAWNYFTTIARRRERHLYVALWFYSATVITIAVLHVFNNLVVPVSALKSYSVYAGVQDAFMQWWYGHNAVAFFLTTPFLGLMYYFLPKAAERPVFSYRLSILHFWSLIFIYIWAGPHHLHYTAVPAWMSTLGMLFSLMLWMPSWGGMLNGLLTLRGAWHKVAEDPILKFFVVGITFYGMSTFEGPLMSIKSVNALSHYTDWTIAHVHAGALGWVGFMVFGMVYWLLPRLYQAELHSRKWMNLHFWLATIGIVLYVVPIYAAGLTQGLMWRAFGETGTLLYGDFLETVVRLKPLYATRAVGGSLYLVGTLLCIGNLIATWRKRPASYAITWVEAPRLSGELDHSPPPAPLPQVAGLGQTLHRFFSGYWHRAFEGRQLAFTIWVAIAVISASLFEIVPTFLVKSNVATIASVTPFTPLELLGRDVYIAEGCVNCHSQMVRPLFHETERYGEFSKAGEFVYDRPFLWGSRRIGPDLHRIGQKITSVAWHLRHLNAPTDTSPGSLMPAYPWLLEDEAEFSALENRIAVMRSLGAPYDVADRDAPEAAMTQAREVVARLAAEDPGMVTPQLERSEAIALVAYLLRLGTDIAKPPPEAAASVVDLGASIADSPAGDAGGAR